jgi:hypothetical protein
MYISKKLKTYYMKYLYINQIVKDLQLQENEDKIM